MELEREFIIIIMTIITVISMIIVTIVMIIFIIFFVVTLCRRAPRHPAAAGLQKKRKRSWVRRCTSRGCCMRTQRRCGPSCALWMGNTLSHKLVVICWEMVLGSCPQVSQMLLILMQETRSRDSNLTRAFSDPRRNLQCRSVDWNSTASSEHARSFVCWEMVPGSCPQVSQLVLFCIAAQYQYVLRLKLTQALL